MPEIVKASLIGAAVIVALGLIVGGVLRHYVGGFLAKVAEEEEAAAEERRAENASEPNGAAPRPSKQ